MKFVKISALVLALFAIAACSKTDVVEVIDTNPVSVAAPDAGKMSTAPVAETLPQGVSATVAPVSEPAAEAPATLKEAPQPPLDAQKPESAAKVDSAPIEVSK